MCIYNYQHLFLLNVNKNISNLSLCSTFNCDQFKPLKIKYELTYGHIIYWAYIYKFSSK